MTIKCLKKKVHWTAKTAFANVGRRALDEFVVDGIETTFPLFRKLVREQDILDGNYQIHWREEFLARTGAAQG